MSSIIYITELEKDECLQRLQKHANRGGWTPWAEGTIAAKISGDSFRLFARGNLNVHNSFAPFFYGRLEKAASGTRIQGRFQVHPMVQMFLVVWFGGLILFGVLILLLSPSAWVLAPAGMMLLGFGFVRLGQWIARGQMESLRFFLARELKAKPLLSGSPNQRSGAGGQNAIGRS